jgi:hypothetical protein
VESLEGLREGLDQVHRKYFAAPSARASLVNTN